MSRQELAKLLINKTRVLLLLRFWLSCLGPLIVLLPNTFILFGFPIFRSWAFLVKVIPEMR